MPVNIVTGEVIEEDALAIPQQQAPAAVTEQFITDSLAQIGRVLDMLREVADPRVRFEGATEAKARSKFLQAATREIGLEKALVQAATLQWIDSRRVRGEALLDMEKATGGDAQRARLGIPTELNTYADLQISKWEASEEQTVARLPYSDYETFITEKAESLALSWTAVKLYAEKFAKKTHVTNNSGENEWYTPFEYIKAARAVMGWIDLDPASCEMANSIIQATVYYSLGDDGLTQEWHGRVWMNPPYSQPEIKHFCHKLRDHVSGGEVSQAVVLVNNATETGWYHALLEVAAAVCLIKGRVKFIDQYGNPDGAPLQGQTVLYMGEYVEKFSEEFEQFGRVLHVD